MAPVTGRGRNARTPPTQCRERQIIMENRSLTKSPTRPLNPIDRSRHPPFHAPGPQKIEVRLNELLAFHGMMTAIALRRDEATAEYVDLKVQLHNGGQFVQRPAGGFQKNDKCISEAARELPMLSKTEEGCRKHIERALKVANLPAEVKTAAIDAGLGDWRMALLEIAKASPELQLAKVREITERKSAPRKRKSSEKAAAAPKTQTGTSDAPARTDVALVAEILPPERAGSMVPSQVNPDALELPAILDRRTSTADAAGVEKAFCELVAIWHRTPEEAQERFFAFAAAELRTARERTKH